ncbi:dienelactone hydrolase family protein [Mesorhizobium sp. 8]|uniref:dienelactone hydrolase family protein n=1 Tax=Mesorhizobium sp. 8 TaxID=2584466 RepID=UPI0011217CF9|nr:dienelactone hydrolase family protein [Mesorhizobium sp. 8]QDC02223.1 dienelactone hydrolase family protein [Mesorhizobium sp. 8]
MHEKDVSIVTRHGTMPAFAVHPEGSGPFPTVILYMDAPGIREELRNMARRIAAGGYYCLLPDLYYRLGTVRFDLPRRDERMSAVVGACMRSIDNDRVNEDTAGMLAFLDGEAAAISQRISCVGFCMSGRYVVAAAAKFAKRFASAASLYGVGLVTEDDGSPHKLVADVPGELYFGFAETDSAAPPKTIETLRTALAAAGTRHDIDVFPGSEHGYCFAAGRAYQPQAAEATWAKLFDLWQRTLT